jgi:hypothetical protein
MNLCLEIKGAVATNWTTFLNLLTAGEGGRRAVPLLLAQEFVLDADDNARL